jgi:hypothetical protein
VRWARAAQPRSLSPEERAAQIQQAATPGGVSEAIFARIGKGDSLAMALEAGIQRSRALAAG